MRVWFDCIECGQYEEGQYEYGHANELNNVKTCNDCYRWHQRLKRGGNIIIGGDLYVENDKAPVREVNILGDHQFLQLEYLDTVPDRFKSRLPSNAEFI